MGPVCGPRGVVETSGAKVRVPFGLPDRAVTEHVADLGERPGPTPGPLHQVARAGVPKVVEADATIARRELPHTIPSSVVPVPVTRAVVGGPDQRGADPRSDLAPALEGGLRWREQRDLADLAALGCELARVADDEVRPRVVQDDVAPLKPPELAGPQTGVERHDDRGVLSCGDRAPSPPAARPTVIWVVYGEREQARELVDTEPRPAFLGRLVAHRDPRASRRVAVHAACVQGCLERADQQASRVGDRLARESGNPLGEGLEPRDHVVPTDARERERRDRARSDVRAPARPLLVDAPDATALLSPV